MDLVRPIIGPIVRYLKYQIKFNNYLKKFKESKDDLRRRKHDIESKLATELRYGKVAKEEVQRWLKYVDEFIARQDVEDEVNGRRCLSCCCRGKILEERTQELKQIYDIGDNYTIECLVIDDPSISVVELPTLELQGNGDVKAKILAYLKGEEVTKLGVCGMGGVGKTTIMKHVYNELLRGGGFKKIIWVTVSQNFDIHKLQEQIAFSLEEKLEKHRNTTNRASTLSKMLEKQKPYLLILDDVWSSFRLEDVGIPEPHVADGCKLVLTTRSQEIARSMGCKRIKVETLSREEALKLFLNKVGDTVLSCHEGNIKRDLESTLKKIVDECDGLPLAIVTVAGSLKEISEPQLWSAALNQLQDCKRNVAGTDDADAFQILKFSYDHLKDQQIQYCFLYCALYPEDYNIPKEEIIEYWIDEGFIDEMEFRFEMKDEGYDILRKLEDNGLLESIKDEVRGDCVRMHALIRDMALDITRMGPQFLVEAGKALKELPETVKCAEDPEKVSLMWNQIEEIPSSITSSTCTKLTTLLLAHNHLSTISESVFKHMPWLKILDLSFNEELRSLPNSVSKLQNLNVLLLESTSLRKVPSLSSLRFLKKLNLRRTKVKEVPEGLGMLSNLKCLFLCGSKDYNLEIDKIADGVLSNLSKLEELIVDWSRIELKGDIVGRLKKLEVFHGWFPTANEMRIFLKCQPDRLSDYFIAVGSKLATMTMIGYFDDGKPWPRYKKVLVFKETSIVGENMLFPSVQVLCIEACHDIRSLNDFSAIKDATDLRRCLIWNCDGMECVLSSWINNPVVQTLEYLRLDELHKLDGLFEANVMVTSSPPPGTFSSLKEVQIRDCKKLKKLFPSWKLVEYLQSLESIYVYNCEEMEEIIGSDPEEEGEEGEEGGDIIKKFILPKLEKLTLCKLPALKSICSSRAVMVCDSLEYIEIKDCNGLRRIPLHLPTYLSYLYLSKLENLDGLFEAEVIAESSPPPETFSSLKEVKIERCKKIKKLFSSWKLVEYLQSLEEISVYDCKQMEEIIASDLTEEEKGEVIKLILPKLKRLHLELLPTLKRICSTRVKTVCDSLEQIQILHCHHLDNLDAFFEVKGISKSLPPPGNCSSLKTISIGYCYKIKKLFSCWMLQGNLQSLEEIYVRHCIQMEEVLSLEPEGEKEGVIKLTLPKLKRLKLIYLPTLKRICSSRAVMVCDSLEHVEILRCLHLENLDALFKEEVKLSNLKIIWINGCGKIKKLIPSLRLLQSVEEINVGCCEQMEELVEKEVVEKGVGTDLGLPKLKRLRLECLPALDIYSITAVMVCASLEEIQILACQRLRRIPLYHLDDLDAHFNAKAFSKSPQLPATYSSLKTISIIECGEIKKLLPSRFLLRSLQSLEEIIVRDCKQMEEIIALDPEEEEEKGEIVKLILPKLKKLHLELLPALKSICSTRVKVVCDSLEHIQILQCHHLDNLDDLFEVEENSMSSPPPGICSSLKTIWIDECSKMKKLFSSRLLLENLQSLEEINVRYCAQMEELVASDPEEGELVMDLVLPKLKLLELEACPH